MNKQFALAAVLAVVMVMTCFAVSDTSDAAIEIADISEPEPEANPTAGTAFCMVGDIQYDDFDEAKAAASAEGQPLILTADYAVDGHINVDDGLIIDLNGHILSIETLATGNGASLTIKNGTILGLELYDEDGEYQITNSAISANTGCTLILDDVDFYAKSSALFVCGDTASATVKNGSVIHAYGYCIGTNAGSTDNYNVELNIENSAIYADDDEDAVGTAILFNVPGTINITGSSVQGYLHGVIVRGGTATIVDSSITNTMDSDSLAGYFDNTDWGTGNAVEVGALILGNKNSSAYQYPTVATVENSTITSNGDAASSYPAVYAIANDREGDGVEFAYDESSIFTNGGTEPSIEIGNDGANVVAGNPTIMVGNMGYVTLQSAVGAVPTDGTETTITLLDDITLSESVEIVAGKNIILDMGGNTITGDSGFTERFIINRGTLTITGNGVFDASDDSGNVYGPLNNYGTLTIENGTFKGNLASEASLIWNRTGGTATFNGGDYSGSCTAIATEADSITYINGGTYNSPWYPAFENNGEATITGGSFTNTSCSTCDNHWGYTIRNGLSSPSAHLVIRPADGCEVMVIGTQGGVTSTSGTMEIYGGTFETVDCPEKHGATFYALYVAGESDDTEVIVYGGEFIADKRAAVQVGNSKDGGVEDKATLLVYAGSFSVKHPESDDYMGVLITDEETQNPPSATVYGGNFSDVLEEGIIATGYMMDSEGNIVIDTSTGNEVIAVIGETQYLTFEGAINAAQPGQTVTLCKDIVVDTWNMIWNIADITIDGDGHTMKVNAIESGDNQDAVFHSAGGNTFEDMTIDMSGITDASQAQGYRAICAYAGDTVRNVNVIGNDLIEYGITVGGSEADAESIVVEDCSITDCGHGVYSDYPADLENLTIKGCRFSGCDYAAILYPEASTFMDNTVSSGKLNIMHAGQTITGNTFSDGSRIKFYDTSAEFSMNRMSSDSYLDFDENVTGPVDVSANYWGGDEPSSTQLGETPGNVIWSNYYLDEALTQRSDDPEPEPGPGGDDDTPVNPPIFDDDDDYVPLPPQIVYDDSGKDDSTAIVACAAAAAVAAIVAVLLILVYRKD